MKTAIEMAREAGFDMPQGESFYQAWPEELERFAELVRADAIAKEREACAKVCEEEWSNVTEKMYGQDCAVAIRARNPK